MRDSKRVGGITRCKQLVSGAYRVEGDAWSKKTVSIATLAATFDPAGLVRLSEDAVGSSTYKVHDTACTLYVYVHTWTHYTWPEQKQTTVEEKLKLKLKLADTLKTNSEVLYPCITQAMFTSAPRALRRGLSIDKQNCRQNSVLIYGF